MVASTEKYTILDSGCIILSSSDYLKFEFEGMVFKLIFIEDKEKEGGTVEWHEEEGHQLVTFTNITNNVMSSASEMANLASDRDNAKIYLKFACQPLKINKNDDIIFYYTWFKERVKNTVEGGNEDGRE